MLPAVQLQRNRRGTLIISTLHGRVVKIILILTYPLDTRWSVALLSRHFRSINNYRIVIVEYNNTWDSRVRVRQSDFGARVLHCVYNTRTIYYSRLFSWNASPPAPAPFTIRVVYSTTLKRRGLKKRCTRTDKMWCTIVYCVVVFGYSSTLLTCCVPFANIRYHYTDTTTAAKRSDHRWCNCTPCIIIRYIC